MAEVEKQDEDKASSVPADSSCLKRLKSIIVKEKEVELKITTEKVVELLQPVRYKPSKVDEMSREIKFTKSEVKFLYRSFKQECPHGIIDEDRFKEVYENIFPFVFRVILMTFNYSLEYHILLNPCYLCCKT